MLKGADKLVYDCFLGTGIQPFLSQALAYDLDRNIDSDFYDVLQQSEGVSSDDDTSPWKGLRDMYTAGQDVTGQPCMYKKEQPNDGAKPTILSTKLVELSITETGMWEGSSFSEIIEDWTDHFKIARVRWLNHVGHSEKALIHGAVSPLGALL